MNEKREVAEETADSMSALDHLFKTGFMVSLCFLCVVCGLLLAVVKSPPYHWVDNAFQAFKAVCVQQEMFSEEYPSPLWQGVRQAKFDVTADSSAGSASGYTLYTSGAGSQVTLLDEAGQPAHQWHAPFSEVWPNAALMKSVIPDQRTFVRRAHVLRNGDLLALYETPLNTPNGMGFARLDRDSNVVWSYEGNCHHDFATDEAGKVYVLTHELKASCHPKSVLGTETNIEDFLTILGSDGKLIKQVSLLDLFFDSPFYRHNILVREHTGDLLHANTVNLVTSEFAQHHADVSAGDLMVCLRNLNMVVIVNPDSEKIVWGASGPWHFPHDPDPLENGNLLIFDNCVGTGLQAFSRVIEFDPRQQKIVWSFSGTENTKLRSDIRSTQQTLDEGNALICESDGGRMVEVNRAGEVVWQFENHQRGGAENQYIPIMAGVRRYSKEQLPFLAESKLVGNTRTGN